MKNMKVILIKDCKDGKVNDVIEVSNGYAINFLINKNFALPYDAQTKHNLTQKLAHIKAIKKIDEQNIQLLKNQIEKSELLFSLKTSKDIVHGSITRKQIQNELRKKNIMLENKQIENIRINQLGTTTVKIYLSKNVTAFLKVKVNRNGK